MRGQYSYSTLQQILFMIIEDWSQVSLGLFRISLCVSLCLSLSLFLLLYVC